VAPLASSLSAAAVDPSSNAEAQRIRVLANVIERGTAGLGFVGCVDCLAANNTIIDPERWPFRILQETTSSDGYTFSPASNGRVINNVIYFNSGDVGGALVNVGPGGAETFAFATNLWFARRPDASTPNLPVAEQAASPATTHVRQPRRLPPRSWQPHCRPSSIPELSGDNDGPEQVASEHRCVRWGVVSAGNGDRPPRYGRPSRAAFLRKPGYEAPAPPKSAPTV
jgi:hypothetical protein